MWNLLKKFAPKGYTKIGDITIINVGKIQERGSGAFARGA